MAVYLEEYLESIENLPAEIKHHLSEIRVRNEQVNAVRKQINEAQKQFLGKEQAPDLLEKVVGKYEEARDLSDEKVSLAEKSIELINRHLKRLESQIVAASKIVDEHGLPVYDTSMDEGGHARPGTSSRKNNRKSRGYNMVIDREDLDGADSFEDDASEPVYCICQQESYGEMIACDNADGCAFEWFHYGCVGLNAPPQGAWYCPLCAPKFKKKKF